MSNLFEDFNFDQPEYLDISLCETETQVRLREHYSSLASRNEIELALFDPNESGTFRSLKLKSPYEDLETEDPQTAFLLKRQMLNVIGLDVFNLSEQDVLTERFFKNGKRSLLFTSQRDDGRLIPVYAEINGSVPTMVCLVSFDKAQDTVLHYRDLDEYHSKIRQKLGIFIADRTLSRFDVAQLKWFNDVYDDLQRIPTIDRP